MRRIADIGQTKQDEGSAYPGSNNYDPQQAKAIIGDLAENVRKFLADKQKCRPPGLQTTSKPDGSITVTADNPEVGIGLTVEISLLNGATENPAPENPAPEEALQVGPPPVQEAAPPQQPQPAPPQQPQPAPATVPPAPLQVGPPPVI